MNICGIFDKSEKETEKTAYKDMLKKVSDLAIRHGLHKSENEKVPTHWFSEKTNKGICSIRAVTHHSGAGVVVAGPYLLKSGGTTGKSERPDSIGSAEESLKQILAHINS